MRVRVDRDLCSGDGVCVETCPDIFEMDTEDLAVVKAENVPEELEDDVREAALTSEKAGLPGMAFLPFLMIDFTSSISEYFALRLSKAGIDAMPSR